LLNLDDLLRCDREELLVCEVVSGGDFLGKLFALDVGVDLDGVELTPVRLDEQLAQLECLAVSDGRGDVERVASVEVGRNLHGGLEHLRQIDVVVLLVHLLKFNVVAVCR